MDNEKYKLGYECALRENNNESLEQLKNTYFEYCDRLRGFLRIDQNGIHIGQFDQGYLDGLNALIKKFESEKIKSTISAHWIFCGLCFDCISEYELWRCSHCGTIRRDPRLFCPTCNAIMNEKNSLVNF